MSFRPPALLAFAVLGAASAQQSQHHMFTFRGDTGGDTFAYGGVRALGDVDRDGVPDVLVGAPQLGVGAGYARVLSGYDGRILYTFQGVEWNDAAGFVSPAGDVDRDGIPDVLVGAPQTYS